MENKTRTVLLNLPEYGLAFLTISIAILVFGELMVREILKFSIFGYTSDLNHILMVWLSMLGAAVGVKRGSHFVFPIIAQRLGPKASPYLSALNCLAILGFAIVLVIVGLKVALISSNEYFLAIRVSLFWENLAVPVSGLLMIPYCMSKLKNQIKIRKK